MCAEFEIFVNIEIVTAKVCKRLELHSTPISFEIGVTESVDYVLWPSKKLVLVRKGIIVTDKIRTHILYVNTYLLQP